MRCNSSKPTVVSHPYHVTEAGRPADGVACDLSMHAHKVFNLQIEAIRGILTHGTDIPSDSVTFISEHCLQIA